MKPLPELLGRVLLELERSNDPRARALLDRVKSGAHTPRDTSDLADMIEALVARERAFDRKGPRTKQN